MSHSDTRNTQIASLERYRISVGEILKRINEKTGVIPCRPSIEEDAAPQELSATNNRASHSNGSPFFQRLWRTLIHAVRKKENKSAPRAISPQQLLSEFHADAKDFGDRLSLAALDRLYQLRKPNRRLRAAAGHIQLCRLCSADISLFLTAPNLYRRLRNGIELPLRNRGTRHAIQSSSQKKTTSRNSNKHSEPYPQRRKSTATGKPKRRS